MSRSNRGRRGSAVTGLAAVVVALSSCSSDSTPRRLPPSPTTVATGTSTVPPPPATTTTTVVPTTSAPSGPATTSPASTPEGHARALYEAWARGDRAAAAAVAEPGAVDALFARPWRQSDRWSFVDCSGAAGSVICTWQGAPGQVLFRVQNVTGGVPVAVSDVRFQP